MVTGRDRVQRGRTGMRLVDCGAQGALVNIDLASLCLPSRSGEYRPDRGNLIHPLVVGRRPSHRGRQSVGVVLGLRLTNRGLLRRLCLASLLQIGPLRQLRISGHVLFGMLVVIHGGHCLLLACLPVHIADLGLAAKSVALLVYIPLVCTIPLAFTGELLDIESDLLSQELGQLLVDAVSSREVRGQGVRTVSFIDMDVLVLSVTDLDCDG